MQKEEGKKRDWRTYEEKLARRIRNGMMQLEPLIDEAIETLHVERGRGRKPSLTLKQKVTILLIKRLFEQSNRSMSSMLFVFTLLTGIDVSYKTIERLYSDPEVYLALCNLHQLILKKKSVEECDTCGDGTGYSLTISKHEELWKREATRLRRRVIWKERIPQRRVVRRIIPQRRGRRGSSSSTHFA